MPELRAATRSLGETNDLFELAVVLFSYLFRLKRHSHKCNRDREEFHEIPAEFLKNVLGNRYRRASDLLISLGCIRFNVKYQTDLHCQHYAIVRGLCEGEHVHYLTPKQKVIARLSEARESTARKCEETRLVMSNLRKISINQESAEKLCLDARTKEIQEIKDKYSKIQPGGIKEIIQIDGESYNVLMTAEDLKNAEAKETEDVEYAYHCRMTQVLNFSNQDFHCKKDSFLRVHHNAVSMWTPLRDTLYAKNQKLEMFSVDTVNSQPWLVDVLMSQFRSGHFKDPEHRKQLIRDMVECSLRGRHYIDISKPFRLLSSEAATTIHAIENDFMSWSLMAIFEDFGNQEQVQRFKDKLQVMPEVWASEYETDEIWKTAERIVSAIEKIAETSDFFHEEKKLRQSCQNGRFYDEIALLADVRDQDDRNTQKLANNRTGFKGDVFQAIYSRNGSKSEGAAIWNSAYPWISRACSLLKEMEHGVLPKMMQRLESRIYIPIFMKWAKKGKVIVPMHDGMMSFGSWTEEEESELVEDIRSSLEGNQPKVVAKRKKIQGGSYHTRSIEATRSKSNHRRSPMSYAAVWQAMVGDMTSSLWSKRVPQQANVQVRKMQPRSRKASQGNIPVLYAAVKSKVAQPRQRTILDAIMQWYSRLTKGPPDH